MTVEVVCPYCSEPAKLVNGVVIYPHREDLFGKKFWQCAPCNAYVGTHANSGSHKPLGRLADAELRAAKMAAHKAFDPMWKNGRRSRMQAYAWLSRRLHIKKENCHIGMFNVTQCYDVVRLCKKENENA